MIFRIYQAVELAPGVEVNLDKDAVNHIVNVLRLKTDDSLIIFNGEGGEYSAEIIQIKRREVKVRINTFQNINRESNLNIHLAQGVSLGEKMDFILQKVTELGVAEITPLITARCNVKLSKDRWDKKISRWQKIIISACEQCGRNILPRLNQAINFADFVAQNEAAAKIILHPAAKSVLSDLDVKQNEVSVLIGPEGGFSTEELQLAEQHNFLSVKLGPRILRTETAGLAITSILQAQCGDLGSDMLH